MKEYKKMLKNMFDFKGRARRREYWVVNVMNSAISCFLYALLFLGCTIAGDSICYQVKTETLSAVGFQTSGSTIGTILVIPIVIFLVYCIVSVLGLTVRRYHDAGIPGWAFPLCLLGSIVIVGAIVHLVFCFLPSKEDNKYGVNPKSPEHNEYVGSTSIGMSILIGMISIILLIICVCANVFVCGVENKIGTSSSEPRTVISGTPEAGTASGTFNGQKYQMDDNSLISFDDDLNYKWYMQASYETSDNNYVSGYAEVYYGEDARTYLVTNFQDNEQSYYNLSDEGFEKLFEESADDPFCSEENLVCIILHNTTCVVDASVLSELGYSSNDDYTPVDVYYWGFYNGETFNSNRIETGLGPVWTRVGDNVSKYVDEVYDIDPGVDTTETDIDIETTENDDISDINDSYNLMIGASTLSITPPAGASDIYSSDSMISYNYGNIYVEYSDSFYEITEDVLAMMQNAYAEETDGADNLNTASSVSPTEIIVGDCTAYYYKIADNYTDDSDFVKYIFFVDIGVENYLEVTIYGTSDEIRDEDAYEIADLGL